MSYNGETKLCKLSKFSWFNNGCNPNRVNVQPNWVVLRNFPEETKEFYFKFSILSFSSLLFKRLRSKNTNMDDQDNIKRALESEFIENLSLDDMREAVKGRTDFRECVYDDHSIFVYFLGMGT
jgi:hypothetical protein